MGSSQTKKKLPEEPKELIFKNSDGEKKTVQYTEEVKEILTINNNFPFICKNNICISQITDETLTKMISWGKERYDRMYKMYSLRKKYSDENTLNLSTIGSLSSGYIGTNNMLASWKDKKVGELYIIYCKGEDFPEYIQGSVLLAKDNNICVVVGIQRNYFLNKNNENKLEWNTGKNLRGKLFGKALEFAKEQKIEYIFVPPDGLMVEFVKSLNFKRASEDDREHLTYDLYETITGDGLYVLKTTQLRF
jgi:hypothetical protein